jgi:pimeloyl-ACP methyl ester carboxylesterase
MRLLNNPTRRCQALLCVSIALVVSTAFLILGPGAALGQRPKNVSGLISDLRGQPLPEARVFVRNLATGVTRTQVSDNDGIYNFYGLPQDADYEVFAEFEGKESERRFVSQFLDRVDNVLNFVLDVAIVPASTPQAADPGNVELRTFDLVELHGSFQSPQGIPAPIPAALLLHGYGEDRSVWNALEERLLVEGWAVMTLDLRGHGASNRRNSEAIAPIPEWRADPNQFPLDLQPALEYLKSQARLDSARIAVVGTNLGANLALIAASRFPEVHTAVALDPILEEALAMTGTAREFTPKMAHLIVSDREAGQQIREFVVGASRVTTLTASGPTAAWLTPGTIDEIVRWLEDTY